MHAFDEGSNERTNCPLFYIFLIQATYVDSSLHFWWKFCGSTLRLKKNSKLFHSDLWKWWMKESKLLCKSKTVVNVPIKVMSFFLLLISLGVFA